MGRRGKPNRFDLPAFIAAVLCGLLIFITLNMPEPVGLANNGDFARVAYSNRLLLTDETKYERFTPRYQMNLAEGNIIRTAASVVLPDYSYYDYYTSLLFPVAFSKVINFARNLLTGAPLDYYNIVWLGLVYTILFVYALYLILKFIRRRFGSGVFYFSAFVAAFVFCDQGYTLYFNSLYGEAFQFVFFFLAAGQYLSMADRERVSVFNCAVYYLVVILMAAAKNAYMPVGLLFIALPFFLGRRIAFPRTTLLMNCGRHEGTVFHGYVAVESHGRAVVPVPVRYAACAGCAHVLRHSRYASRQSRHGWRGQSPRQPVFVVVVGSDAFFPDDGYAVRFACLTGK